MVCLNKYISFNKIKLRNNINNYLSEHIRLDLILNLDEIKIDKIKTMMNKTINDYFSDDHQIYLSMDDNLCTYKHKKGKNEGKFCCKKITKNGDKNKYICTIHNKNHTPKKRLKKNFCEIPEVLKFNNHNDVQIKKINKNNKIIKKNKFKKKNKIKIKVQGEINFYEILSRLL